VTELERLAAAVLAQWRHDGGSGGGPIEVCALLDRVFPYRAARRVLGIDISEDYEALILRLIAEEEGLVRVFPPDAVELAKETLAARLPDLGTLELLRSATITFSDAALSRLSNVLPIGAKPESQWTGAPERVPEPEPEPEPEPTPLPFVAPPPPAAVAPCWSCGEMLPAARAAKFCPQCGADQREPVCTACGTRAERGWKHCLDCGAKL
jgi:hypothetical protein